MSRFCAAIVAVLLSAGMGTADLAQETAGPQRDRQVYRSATTAILVDVVVRDKQGRLVTDLSAADFDVAEDGVPQKIDTFARVSHGSDIGVSVAWRSPRKTVAVSQTTTQPEAASAGIMDDATTALVFDHIRPTARWCGRPSHASCRLAPTRRRKRRTAPTR